MRKRRREKTRERGGPGEEIRGGLKEELNRRGKDNKGQGRGKGGGGGRHGGLQANDAVPPAP